MKDYSSRFTQTVQDYIKYRPSYPRDVLQVLIDECGLTKDKVIADIGCGTGLLAKLFVENGNPLYGVEPNDAMRLASDDFLKAYPDFHSVKGTAEDTTLDSHSVDFVIAGTAFHWFDADKAKHEFKRILRSPGWVMLVWNVRNLELSPLMREYEELIIDCGTDYAESNARKFEKTVEASFFSPNEMKMKSFRNSQQFDWEGLQGRLLSTSYSLRPGDDRYDEMMRVLRVIFDRYQENGMVTFLYDTKIYYGCL